MDDKKNCCNKCGCELSKCNLDMTVRECIEQLGINPEAVEQFLKNCCKR